MTKAELVKLLENYPDDMIVLARWGRNELNNDKDIRGVEVVEVMRDLVHCEYKDGTLYDEYVEMDILVDPKKKVINII